MDNDKKTPSKDKTPPKKESQENKKTTTAKKPGRPAKVNKAKSVEVTQKTAAAKDKKDTPKPEKTTTTKAKKTTKPKPTKATAKKPPKTNKKTTATKKAKTSTKPSLDKKQPISKETTKDKAEVAPNKQDKQQPATPQKTTAKTKAPSRTRQVPAKNKPTKTTNTEQTTTDNKQAGKEVEEPVAFEAKKTAPHQKNTAAPKKPTTRPNNKTVAKNGPNKTEQKKQPTNKPSTCKLLINAEEPEECRIALLENGKLEAFYIETVSRERTKGNIYKGKIVSIETNLQAAFVDIGTGKNAFLPFSEIHPEYYSKELPNDTHWKDVKFKECMKIGQEILLEVVKEPTGNKGANMTTFLSLPGRYVVLMPGSESHGISRQIDSQEERRKLRDMLESCKLPEGVGYIIRTASKGITKTALTQDVRFLIKLWRDIRAHGQTEAAPALVYGEQNIITRFLRDHLSTDIHEIQVDSQDAFTQVKSFLDLLPAAQKKKITARLHKGPRPLLNSHNIEEQIEQIYRPTVKLPSGGSIVINPTEALVAIDVNSGSTGKDKNFTETIFLANMEAAEELARQLRLRDLGGLIVVDFIDMRPAAHIREVEKKVKASTKRDKAKMDFARISKFGLMQISRQRMGSPIAARNYITCSCCQGRGMIRSIETQALAALRQIQTSGTRKNIKTIRCHLPMDVSQYLLNKKRSELSELERRYKVTISVEIDPSLKPANANIEFLKET